MTGDELMSFEQALQEAGSDRKHLILGNGFSMACRSDIFSYTALYENAEFPNAPELSSVFDNLGTRDFEHVIKALDDSTKILESYGVTDDSLSQKLRDHREVVKEALVQAIASRHPDRPFDIGQNAYRSCRRFLSYFNKIYTLNYDVLLYWALMQEDIDDLNLNPDDGFRAPAANEDADYVAWESYHSASVHYLHGALHLFDAGYELRKYTWSRTETAIIDQVRDALANDLYPLFVSEGDSMSKMTRIQHNAYLHRSYRSLGEVKGSIFIFGHSLAENDDHIFRQMMTNNTTDIYVSVFGGADEKAAVEARTEQMNSWVGPKKKKKFHFFDAKTAGVWG